MPVALIPCTSAHGTVMKSNIVHRSTNNQTNIQSPLLVQLISECWPEKAVHSDDPVCGTGDDTGTVSTICRSFVVGFGRISPAAFLPVRLEYPALQVFQNLCSGAGPSQECD